MSIVAKPHTFSPSTTISSSQVNSDFDTLYNDYNGNIAAANLATDAVTTSKIADSNVTTAKIADSNVTTAKLNDAAVTPAKLIAGTGTTWAWASWTPTFTNLTVGSGTLSAKYIQIGKTVHCRLKFTLGAGSAVGTSPYFTLPVTAHADYAGSDNGEVYESTVGLIDAGTAYYHGALMHRDVNTALLRKIDTSANLSGITASLPFVWGTSDFISVKFTYEAA